MKRRELIKAAASLAVSLPITGLLRAETPAKKVLMMGGTGFIGPHIVRALLAQGHSVTLCNRGKSNPGLFKDLELVKADRLTEDIQQLQGRQFELVVDSSCYDLLAIELLIAQLDLAAIEQYVFISSIGVYADLSQSGLTEDSPLVPPEGVNSKIRNVRIVANKVLCEIALDKALPGRATHLRLGAPMGPGDNTDNFTYWPERIFRGGEVVGPGTGEQYLQAIDARDLADWIVHCTNNGVFGSYNCTSPARGFTLGDVIAISKERLNPGAEIVWIPEDYLLTQKVRPFMDLPMWMPMGTPMAGVMQIDTSKAIAAGLKHRPLERSIMDLHDWFQSLPEERRSRLKVGWSREREQEILTTWRTMRQSERV